MTNLPFDPPHLDDESLSAALDGEDAAAAAHLSGCAACQSRADRLVAAIATVADTPLLPAPIGFADRAVAAALAAYSAERSGGAEGNAVVVPLRRARRVPPWALGAAAAVAALLVAVPVLTRDKGDDSQQTVAAAVPATEAAKVADAAGSAAAAVVDGGDLGEQTDPLVVSRVLAAAVGGGASPPGPSQFDSSESRVAAPQASAAGATTTVPVPVTAGVAAPAPVMATAGGACEAALPAVTKAALGPLVYRGTLRWQGTPSVVLAYRLPTTSGGEPRHRLLVISIEGCRLLVDRDF